MTTLLRQSSTALRPRYAEGQILGAAELIDEQEYLIASRRRHLISGHAAGIVTGLEPSLTDGVLAVSPGFAVDGCGRELVISEVTQVPAPGAGQATTADLDIYVQYERVATSGDDPGHPRWIEQVVLRCAPPDGVPPPAGDLIDLPEDDEAGPWPVLIGVLTQGGSAVDLGVRRYAAAVGGAVMDPRGVTRLALQRSGALAVTGVGAGSPLLEADAGGVTLTHDAMIAGSVTAQRTVELRSRKAPAAPSPWSLSRISGPAVPSPASGLGSGSGSPPAPSDELRIELPAPPTGPDPAQRAVSFGERTAAESFARSMSVLADGTVVISGNLVIEGRLATGPVPADPSDARLRQAMIDTWVGAATGALRDLEVAYTGELSLGNLQVTSSGARQLSCTVTVLNTGAASISSIRVTAEMTMQGSSSAPSVQTLATIELAPSQSQTVSKLLTAPASGGVNVVVRATGSGLAGTTINAQALTASAQV
jgi:hypothetical protein